MKLGTLRGNRFNCTNKRMEINRSIVNFIDIEDCQTTCWIFQCHTYIHTHTLPPTNTISKINWWTIVVKISYFLVLSFILVLPHWFMCHLIPVNSEVITSKDREQDFPVNKCWKKPA